MPVRQTSFNVIRRQPSQPLPVANDVEAAEASGVQTCVVQGQPSLNAGTVQLMAQLCLCSALDGADAVLLPSTIRALQSDLGLSMHHVALLNLVQAITIASVGPFWGIMADQQRLQRKTILVLGTIVQGVLTIALGLTSTFGMMLVLRGLNGAMLSALRPVANGIVADVTSEGNRGVAYGWIEFSVGIGMMAGALTGTPLSTEIIMDCQGWRVAYVIVGSISMLVGSCLAFSMEEPCRDQAAAGAGASPFKHGGFRDALSGLILDLKTPTFVVIILQGCFGSIPTNAMSYQTLFYQVSGLGDGEAATLQACSLGVGSVGRLLGGRIGDAFARVCPAYGRPLAAQISVLSGIIIVACIFLGEPPQSAAFTYYASAVVLLGMMATWCAAGVNRPILSEIVSPARRSSIMAWQSAVEGTFSAVCGNVAVGFLAQDVYGFDMSSAATSGMDLTNKRALGSALLFTTCGPWTICLLFYGLLYFTYPRDRGWNMERVKKQQGETPGDAKSRQHQWFEKGDELLELDSQDNLDDLAIAENVDEDELDELLTGLEPTASVE